MLLKNNTNVNYSPRQLKLPLDIEKIIDVNDPVYSFSEIVDRIDFTEYMWLLAGMEVPIFATFGNFIRDELTTSIEDIIQSS